MNCNCRERNALNRNERSSIDIHNVIDDAIELIYTELDEKLLPQDATIILNERSGAVGLIQQLNVCDCASTAIGH